MFTLPLLMQPQTLINGQASDAIGLSDRGLAYGHGLFETFLVIDGQPVFYQEHLQRLFRGCKRLGIPSDCLDSLIQQDLQKLVYPAGRCVLKLILTCGSGGRGYLTPDPASPARILILTSMPEYPDSPEDGIRVRWCQTQLACQPLLSGIKHLNRLEQVLARNEWHGTDIREGLVCDTRGFVIEGTMSNLCFIHEGRFCTPALDQNGIEGVIRNQLMQLAVQQGLKVEVSNYTPQDVLSADEIFLCNSLIGVWPVVALENHQYAVGPHTRSLQAALTQRMVQC
ncbi:aminodeoxychorismate lyase [Marinobacterium sediminicola]|uniref:Aminodeoxychorismate lyase n=1 Tax=Marinobacterium sediminicola TaxID=518898 RepID=A0ABY1RXK5_9GAMM|nr:aminodeoxychorismate lyase [Marinobacterium sediminicola]ULG70772.1 aminodeoxychorismate lyase [Marinobacterium sediminicola]SMR71651.1 4-amino-4-deoxychorismate lyase [Marinobacterium sediminicola]